MSAFISLERHLFKATPRAYIPRPLTASQSSKHPDLTSQPWRKHARMYSDEATAPVDPPEYLSQGERKVFDTIKDSLNPSKLEVQDISGGCGSMYALDIVSEQFKGLPIIKQHRLVNKVLGDEIKKWHGVQLKTKAP